MSKEQQKVIAYFNKVGISQFARECARNTLPEDIALAKEFIEAHIPLIPYSTTSFGEQS